jgi:hypothetical protein
VLTYPGITIIIFGIATSLASDCNTKRVLFP